MLVYQRVAIVFCPIISDIYEKMNTIRQPLSLLENILSSDTFCDHIQWYWKSIIFIPDANHGAGNKTGQFLE